MSAFWDNMTAPRPINKVVVSNMTNIKPEHSIESLLKENQNLKLENSLLKEELGQLRKVAAEKSRPITGLTMTEMLNSVTRYTNVQPEQIRRDGRLKKTEVRARTLFALIAHYNGRSDKAIGGFLNRNRYVALDARRNHKRRLKKTDYEFLKLYSNGHL